MHGEYPISHGPRRWRSDSYSYALAPDGDIVATGPGLGTRIVPADLARRLAEVPARPSDAEVVRALAAMDADGF